MRPGLAQIFDGSLSWESLFLEKSPDAIYIGEVGNDSNKKDYLRRLDMKMLPVDVSINKYSSLKKHVFSFFSLSISVICLYALARAKRYSKISNVALPIIAGVLLARFFYRVLKDCICPWYNVKTCDKTSPSMQDEIRNDPQSRVFKRQIVVENRGIKYYGVLYTTKDLIKCKKWVLYYNPGVEKANQKINKNGQIIARSGFNTLMMDGPSMEQSPGPPTQKALLGGIEAGFHVLDTIVKAEHIWAVGPGFSGGVLAEGEKRKIINPSIRYDVSSINPTQKKGSLRSLMIEVAGIRMVLRSPDNKRTVR